jgi:hypothetical protein
VLLLGEYLAVVPLEPHRPARIVSIFSVFNYILTGSQGLQFFKWRQSLRSQERLSDREALFRDRENYFLRHIVLPRLQYDVH